MKIDLKTTICGIISGAASWLALNPNIFGGEHASLVTTIASFIVAGGLAGLGIAAKDASKGSDLPAAVVDEKIAPLPPVQSSGKLPTVPPVLPGEDKETIV
jgi:hypothetical protein